MKFSYQNIVLSFVVFLSVFHFGLREKKAIKPAVASNFFLEKKSSDIVIFDLGKSSECNFTDVNSRKKNPNFEKNDVNFTSKYFLTPVFGFSFDAYKGLSTKKNYSFSFLFILFLKLTI